MKFRLYEILGVDKKAAAADIRDAYRAKAKHTHPDAGGDIAEFQELSKAYAILGDPVKRVAYDATGQEEGPPATEDAATLILRNLVELAINGGGDPKYSDLVKEMRRPLEDGLRETKAKLNEIGRRIDRCRVMAARFTAKSGENLVRKMLEGRITEMERQVVGINTEREHIEAAMKLLSEYQYEVDARQNMAYQTGLNQQAQHGGFGFGVAF